MLYAKYRYLVSAFLILAVGFALGFGPEERAEGIGFLLNPEDGLGGSTPQKTRLGTQPGNFRVVDGR